MRCQYCGYLDSKVIDSRPTEEGSAIRRRRECLRCGRRFTTYEKIETSPIMVTPVPGWGWWPVMAVVLLSRMMKVTSA